MRKRMLVTVVKRGVTTTTTSGCQHLMPLVPKLLFSSSSEPPPSCDIVKGPSLLRTSVHRPRPSLLHLPGLRSLPFWSQTTARPVKNDNNDTQHEQDDASHATKVAYRDPRLTWAVQHFEQHYDTILKEYETVMASKSLKSDYQTDTEHSLHQGSWDWHSYMLKGQTTDHFSQHFPETTRILDQVRQQGLLFEHTPFGYSFFSTLHGNSQIAAHAAPMNLRIRLHLPLIVPSEDATQCGLRVGASTRPWHTGRALLLDDSYEHQVWNETDQTRVLLLVDLWHPDVSPQEQEDVIGLFAHAKEQGWWKNE